MKKNIFLCTVFVVIFSNSSLTNHNYSQIEVMSPIECPFLESSPKNNPQQCCSKNKFFLFSNKDMRRKIYYKDLFKDKDPYAKTKGKIKVLPYFIYYAGLDFYITPEQETYLFNILKTNPGYQEYKTNKLIETAFTLANGAITIMGTIISISRFFN